VTDFNFAADNVIRISGFLGKAEPTNPDEMLLQATEALREISITLEKISKVLQEFK